MTTFKVLNREFIDSILDGIECSFAAHGGEKRDFSPNIDVLEDSKGYLLKMDLPGFKDEDLRIEIDKRQLKISGELKGEAPAEDVKFLYRERRTGSFKRVFPLPEEADSETITAKLAEGLLTVRIEKRPEEQPRKVNIS